ncbi:MAG: hypothetical protein JSV03_14655 [Planctomycetota bacterium]|nr:MAG: hypothetical protein JSV03_14655 [Planctomycetota bacterium]
MSGKATVIKADRADAIGALGLQAFSYEDLMVEARRMVAAASNESVAIKQAASQEGYRAGYEEGFAEGQIAGRDRALAEAAEKFKEQQSSLIGTCKQLIAGIDADRKAWYVSARRDLIDLAMAIARRVVLHVGQRERNAVLANLEEGIQLAGARSEVTIIVNPVDADAARLFADSLIEVSRQWEHVRVIAEPEVSPGGCRIQWGTGAVDATLETQLDRIHAELNGAETEIDRNG